MKCPLLTIASVWATPEQKIKALDCLKEECAWWNVGFECCVLHALRDDLNEISSALQGILIKMPSLEAFKK